MLIQSTTDPHQTYFLWADRCIQATMANKSDRRRRQEGTVDSIFAVVPMPPLGTPTLGLRSNYHKRLKDLGPADSSDEEKAITTTSQSAFEIAKEFSVWRIKIEEIAKILRKNFLAGMEKDDRGSVRERSRSLHSRSSVGSSSQATLSINNRRPQEFNDRIQTVLNVLKQEYEEQRQEQRFPSKPVGQISTTPLSNFVEEEFSECASWDWGKSRPPRPAEMPITPVQGIRKSTSVDHESFPLESPNTSRSRKLSNHQRSPRTPSYQPKTQLSSRDQGMRTPTSRTKSPSSRSQRSRTPISSRTKSPSSRSQRSRTPTSSRTKSPSTRRQRSRTPSSPVKSPTSRSQQTQHTPTSRPKSPSSRRQRSRTPSSPIKSPTSRSQQTQYTRPTTSRTKSPSSRSRRPPTPSSPAKSPRTSRSQQTQHSTPASSRTKSPSSRSQRTQHQTPSRAKSPSGRSSRTYARTPTSRAKSPSKRSSYHQRTIGLPIFQAPITPTGALHNVCYFSYGRPQLEFADSLDPKVVSPRAHRKFATDQIEQQLRSENTSAVDSDDSVSSAGSTSPMLEKVRKWSQNHVRAKRRRTSSRKLRESFSCHTRTVSLKEFLSESEKNSNYLVQAKNRHEARRQLNLKPLHRSCYF